jgi:hypothetical protein
MGSFGVAVKEGSDYEMRERFTPLHGKGRPLWEFKEFGHRLYCLRIVENQGSIRVVLLSGWKKDKEGKGANEEKHEIEKAQRLLEEYESLG